MSAAAPNHPDPAPVPGLDPGIALRLPADAYYHLVHTLRLALPPPPGGKPEDLLRRDHAAIARIAALVPANAAEADLAAQFVAASEYWKDCLRLAELPETTPDWAHKCRAQANSMMRQANAALRLLLRMQAAREKRDADQATRDRAAWTEHCALSLMVEALSGRPAKSTDFAGTPPSRPPAAPAAMADPPAPPAAQPEPAAIEEPPADPVAAAEQYAAVYPERAALIRRLGRLPDGLSFDPPDDDVLQALIAGRNASVATNAA